MRSYEREKKENLKREKKKFNTITKKNNTK